MENRDFQAGDEGGRGTETPIPISPERHAASRHCLETSNVRISLQHMTDYKIRSNTFSVYGTSSAGCYHTGSPIAYASHVG